MDCKSIIRGFESHRRLFLSGAESLSAPSVDRSRFASITRARVDKTMLRNRWPGFLAVVLALSIQSGCQSLRTQRDLSSLVEPASMRLPMKSRRTESSKPSSKRRLVRPPLLDWPSRRSAISSCRPLTMTKSAMAAMNPANTSGTGGPIAARKRNTAKPRSPRRSPQATAISHRRVRKWRSLRSFRTTTWDAPAWADRRPSPLAGTARCPL